MRDIHIYCMFQGSPQQSVLMGNYFPFQNVIVATWTWTFSMGLLLSLPLAGPLGTIATSCLGGLAFCFTSTAGLFGEVPRRFALTPGS